MAKYDHLKETFYKFYNNNRNLSRKEIFDKFHDLGAPKRTLNRWLASLEQNKTLARENGSGRVAKKVTRTVKQQIKKSLIIALVVHKERSLRSLIFRNHTSKRF